VNGERTGEAPELARYSLSFQQRRSYVLAGRGCGGTGLSINSPPTRASASLGPPERILSPSLMRGKNFGIAAASSLRHVRQLRRVEITRPGADFCKGEAGELLVERVMPSRRIETTKLSLRSQAAPVHAQCTRPGEMAPQVEARADSPKVVPLSLYPGDRIARG
jgi:hypothetical protein